MLPASGFAARTTIESTSGSGCSMYRDGCRPVRRWGHRGGGGTGTDCMGRLSLGLGRLGLVSAQQAVFYVLDWSHATNELIWHVIYGPSRDEAKWIVAVNASSGDFIRVEK